MKALAGFIGLARSFFDAFVLLCFWGWFVVPLGAPRINYVEAFGLDLTVCLIFLPSYMKNPGAETEEDGDKQVGFALGRVLVYGCLLGLGFIVHEIAKG